MATVTLNQKQSRKRQGAMRERQRAEIVRNLLAERGFVSIADVMAATGVSAASARRDAGRLAEAGFAERIHGGIQALDGAFSQADGARNARHPLLRRQPHDQYRRQARHRPQRRSRCATDGDVVIINGGTTTFQMAEFLRDRRLKILTNSYPLAEFLIHETQNRVALPGGEVYRDQKLIVAPFDDDAIQHYSARLMFMSAISIGPLGVIEGDPLIARAETKLLRRADKLVVLADASKFAAARQPGRLPAFAHPHAHHRLGRAAGGARHAARGEASRRSSSTPKRSATEAA